MSLLSEIAQYIEDEGLATQGTDLFIGNMPDTPDTCVCLYQTDSTPDDYIPIHEYRIQMMVRAKRYTTAEDLAENIFHVMQHKQNSGSFVTDGIEIRYVLAIQRPTPIGRDEKEREVFSHNYRVGTSEYYDQT